MASQAIDHGDGVARDAGSSLIPGMLAVPSPPVFRGRRGETHGLVGSQPFLQ